MKQLSILCICIITFGSRGLSQVTTDTNFIFRQNTEYYYAIFIDTNRHSGFYSDLEEHTNSPFDSTFYFANIKQFKKKKVRIARHQINNFPLDWSPLYLYKSSYYVYMPSDGMYGNWVCINDSLVNFYAGGEMLAYAINSFKELKQNKFQFDLTDDNGKRRKILIHIIDKTRGIAVFEYPEKSNDLKYELRVATDKLRNFPIIVNYCLVQKQMEFDFDSPDFKKLLQE